MFATEESSSRRARAWIERNYKWLVGIGLFCLLLARLTVHFSYFEEDRRQALELIRQHHAWLNAGQFEDIYDDASLAFQQSQTRENLTNAMEHARNEYGTFLKMSSSDVKVFEGIPVRIRAQCDSIFENGEATEWFVFVEDGPRIRLLLYKIQWKNGPPAVIPPQHALKHFQALRKNLIS